MIGSHWLPVVLQVDPTAQAFLEEVAATSASMSMLPGPGLGLATFDQAVPFQRAISVYELVQPLVVQEESPTAQALLRELAATPNRAAEAPGSGLASLAHFVPFQWKITVLSDPVAVSASPAAHTSLAEVAASPERRPKPTAGTAACDHLVPFQCMIRGV
jgi:hypothetical protein